MATWDETKPAGTRNPKLGDDDIREFKQCVRERLAIDHEAAASESPAFGAAGSKIGTHKAVRLNEQAADPTTLENQAAIYAKEADSATELFMRPESDGTAIRLTRGGCAAFNTLPFNDGTYAITFPTNGMAAAKIMLGNSSTIIWMYLNTAPPGWKALSTGADMVLAVAGGAAAYNVNGGNPDSVAAWAISGLTADAHTHAGPSHVHTGPSHTHDLSNHTHAGPSHTHTGPSHTHSGTTSAESAHTHVIDVADGSIIQRTPSNGSSSANTGAGTPHQHTVTVGAAGTGATGAAGTGATGAPSNNTSGAGGTGNTGAAGTGNTGAASATGVSSTGAWRPKASVGKLFQLDTA